MRSQSMYIQSIGRALRPLDDVAHALSREASADRRREMIIESAKPFATVLDVIDQGSHSLVTVASLEGLPAKFDLRGTSARQARKRYEALERELPWIAPTVSSVDEIETVLMSVDAFSSPLPPPPDPAWKPTGREYVLQLPRRVDGERANGEVERGIYGMLRARALKDQRPAGRPVPLEKAARALGFRRLHYRHAQLVIRQVERSWEVVYRRNDAPETRLGCKTHLKDAFRGAQDWLRLGRSPMR
jgi:hypothetical protein